MSCFCIGISGESRGRVTYPYQKQYHRLIEHKFVDVFIAYYTFDVDLMDFCMFKLGTILYKKVVPAIYSPFRDHIASDHIKTSHIMS